MYNKEKERERKKNRSFILIMFVDKGMNISDAFFNNEH